MIGIIVVTHHTLAETLIETAEQIVGPLDNVESIGIAPADDVEQIKKRLAAAISALKKQGKAVLIMTDMFGGTPSNISLSFFEPDSVEIISGVNLPMLLKLATERQQRSLPNLASFITEYGRKNIFSAVEFLGQ
ncbi:MAG: PTS sugar transporter [Deltaproteobacteria bacterium]|nr:PTS sugar transporter [Candidatus Anaeroferrophillus wilburensis]MBN2889464.1 PTS sugar transporter [Deltaproteobacteria bacterium]